MGVTDEPGDRKATCMSTTFCIQAIFTHRKSQSQSHGIQATFTRAQSIFGNRFLAKHMLTANIFGTHFDAWHPGAHAYHVPAYLIAQTDIEIFFFFFFFYFRPFLFFFLTFFFLIFPLFFMHVSPSLAGQIFSFASFHIARRTFHRLDRSHMCQLGRT